MRRATVSLSELPERLRGIEEHIRTVAAFQLDDPDIPEMSALVTDEFFSIGEPSAAPSRGRGERVTVPLGWIWWPSAMPAGRGAELVVEKLRSVPGVEDVTPPRLDPQFGLVWRTTLTLRLSQ